MNCSTCKEELRLQGTEGEYVRALCLCEKLAKKLCKDCGDIAVQARLPDDDLNTPSAFYCREHGLTDYMEAAPAPKYNLTGTTTGRLSTSVPQVANKPKGDVSTMRPQDDPQTNFWVQCHCGDTHLDKDRLWTEPSPGTWTSKCPNCKLAGPVFYIDAPANLTETKRGRTKANRTRAA